MENAAENTGVRLVRNTAASDSDGAGVACDVGADVATHPAPGSTTTCGPRCRTPAVPGCVPVGCATIAVAPLAEAATALPLPLPLPLPL